LGDFLKQLEEILDGWKINRAKKILYDGRNSYEYLDIWKLGNVYKVKTIDGGGFIFPNTPGIFELLKGKDNFTFVILRKDDKKFFGNLKKGLITSGYDGVRNCYVANNTIYARIKQEDKWLLIKLDEKEIKSKLYDEIFRWKVTPEAVYLEVHQDEKAILVKLDNELKEICRSEEYEIGIHWGIENDKLLIVRTRDDMVILLDENLFEKARYNKRKYNKRKITL